MTCRVCQRHPVKGHVQTAGSLGATRYDTSGLWSWFRIHIRRRDDVYGPHRELLSEFSIRATDEQLAYALKMVNYKEHKPWSLSQACPPPSFVSSRLCLGIHIIWVLGPPPADADRTGGCQVSQGLLTCSPVPHPSSSIPVPRAHHQIPFVLLGLIVRVRWQSGFSDAAAAS